MSIAHVSWFAGVVAFLAAAVAATACGGAAVSNGDGDASSGPSSGAAAGLIADQPSSGSQADGVNAERKVVINSTLRIEVEKLNDAYVQVSTIARRSGGFVAESSISGEASGGGATLRLRVPASEHDAVVSQIRDLGSRVVKESTNSREVTEEYTDLEARLRNLQRTEAQYQQFLGQAKTLDEVLNVSNRLDGVRGQIEQAQGRVTLLDNLSDFATINVALALPALNADRPSPLEVFVSAWNASTDVALALANVLAATLVLLLWLLVLAPFGLLGLRYGRRLAPVARRIIEW